MRGRLLSIPIGMALLMGTGGVTSAEASGGDSISQLLVLNPGVSRTQMVAQLRSHVTVNRSLQKVADIALRSQRQALADAGGSLSMGRLPAATAGGGGGVVLGKGKRQGDIYYSPSGNRFVTWGHNGLYYHTDRVSEAPGPKQVSQVLLATSRMVVQGAQKLSVNHTSSTTRLAAANWTGRHLGRPYRYNFAFNRYVESGDYNCSQFVWAAYMSASRGAIDLDDDGRDWAVYPAGIRDSGFTDEYQRL